MVGTSQLFIQDEEAGDIFHKPWHQSRKLTYVSMAYQLARRLLGHFPSELLEFFCFHLITSLLSTKAKYSTCDHDLAWVAYKSPPMSQSSSSHSTWSGSNQEVQKNNVTFHLTSFCFAQPRQFHLELMDAVDHYNGCSHHKQFQQSLKNSIFILRIHKSL